MPEERDRIETFWWPGEGLPGAQIRYRCPITFPNGVKCPADRCSMEELLAHVSADHERAPRYNEAGKQIKPVEIRDYSAPGDKTPAFKAPTAKRRPVG